MKKIIAIVLCLIFSICLIPNMALAQEGSFYYNDNFSNGLNTDKTGGKPYWSIDNTTGGTISIGKDPTNSANDCLILNKTTANDNGATKVETSLWLNEVTATADKPYVVVEGRVMFSAAIGKSNLFFMFGGATSAGRLMTNALYNNFVFTTGSATDSTKFIPKIDAKKWYSVKYIIDPSKEVNTYDVVLNDRYVTTIEDPKANAKFNTYSINRLLFGLNFDAMSLYLDDLKVYTAADKPYTAEENFYLNEDFSNGLDTDNTNGKPYWSIDNITGGTISVGADPKNSANTCLILNKTTANDNGATKVETSLHFNDVVATADKPYVMVEGKVLFSGNGKANLFFMFGGPTSAGRLMTNALYNNFVFTTGAANDSTKFIPKITANTWYNIKYVIDPSKTINTYDVLLNGQYFGTIEDAKNTAFNTTSVNRLLFGMNYEPVTVYLDDLKVYTSANKGFSYGFSDGFDTNKGLWKWNNADNNGKVSVEVNPDNEYDSVLALDGVVSGTPKAEIEIPCVYATATNPRLVVKGRFKNTGGNSKQVYIYGGQNNNNLGLSLITYGNRMIVNDRTGTTTNNTDYLKPYDNDAWYDVTVIFDTSTTDHTFDLYLDGELKVENAVARMNMPSITKLLMDKTKAGIQYIDDLKVFNPGNSKVVTEIELADTTYVIPETGETTYPLTLNIVDETGAAPSAAQVVWSLSNEKAGVTLTDNNLVVSSAAVDGSVGLEAEVTVDGISYKKNFVVDLGKDRYGFTEAFFTYDGKTPATELVGNSTLKAEFKATKITDEETSPFFVAAVFKGDVLESVVKSETPVSKRLTTISIPVSIPEDVTGVTVKLFKWDLKNGLSPYDTAVTFPAKSE